MIEERLAKLLDVHPDFNFQNPNLNLFIGYSDDRRAGTIYIQASSSGEQPQHTNGNGKAPYAIETVQLLYTGSNNYYGSKILVEKLYDHLQEYLGGYPEEGIIHIINQTPTLLSRTAGNINEFVMDITITYERNN